MKIGIMSMQRIANYGSFLQSYCLKIMCESLGHTVEFVDFRVGKTIDERKNLVSRIRADWRLIKQSQLLRPIRRMRQKGKIPSTTIRNYSEFLQEIGVADQKNFSTNYDALIIGSDEVFNCTQNNIDVGYSLGLFGKGSKAKKTISYAASFGTTTLEKIEQYQIGEKLSYYLKKMDSISVRDENSRKIAEILSGKKVQLHLDPVLVGQLETLDSTVEVPYNHYVIVYSYPGRFSEKEGADIQKFVHERGLQSVSIYGKQKFCDIITCCRPLDILSYYRKAEYVITDTFHGTIFAIITHKPFVTLCRRTDERGSGNSEKLQDLLNRLDLKEREIKSTTEIDKVIDRPIDFEYIDTIRKTERQKTLSYLQEQLQ